MHRLVFASDEDEVPGVALGHPQAVGYAVPAIAAVVMRLTAVAALGRGIALAG